jgi:hypothetical protein
VFTIPDPNLQLNQLDQVQRDVAALLEQGLPSLEPAPVASDTPAPSPEEPPTLTDAAESVASEPAPATT